MERRENRLIEDSSSNFACLCPRKRRLPRGKASTSPPPSSPLPIRNAPRSAIAGSLFAHPCRGLRLVWPTSSAFNERKNAPGLAIVQCDFLLGGFSFFFLSLERRISRCFVDTILSVSWKDLEFENSSAKDFEDEESREMKEN